MMIAIIDDNMDELNNISTLINNEFKQYSTEYTIDKINDPYTLNMDKYYNILFLDIYMPKDGIELAKEYLSVHKNTLIIFISNYTERVFDTFDVHPFYFIKKNNISQCLKTLILTLINKFKVNNYFISIKCDIGLIDLALNKIKYIKSDRHYCYFVTPTQKYKVRNKLCNIIALLNNDFHQIHKTTIINWQYVEEFNDRTIKINKEYLSISRTYLANTKEAYRCYVLRNI